MKAVIQNFLQELDKKIAVGNPFLFWEFLENADSLLKNLLPKIEGRIEENVVVGGNLFLGKNSVIKSGSRIEGNVFIGENCIIGPNAFLRGNAIIANDCFIGTSEIKSSIILSNTKIPHFSYVGDSIL